MENGQKLINAETQKVTKYYDDDERFQILQLLNFHLKTNFFLRGKKLKMAGFLSIKVNFSVNLPDSI